MRSWILVAVALAAAAGSVHGQASTLTEEQVRTYQSTAQKALDAHKAGKYDEAIAGFKACLSLVPSDWSSAYNVACGYSLKKELDPAVEWLDKAIDLGFGRVNIESDELGLAEKTDTDLANMRADARFAKAIERMKAGCKALEEYTSKPAVHVPAALNGVAGVPVLIVLHDQGATKDAPVQGFWKEIAEELGLVLIAPSALMPMADEPAKGMSWFNDPDLYQKGYWKYEKTIN